LHVSDVLDIQISAKGKEEKGGDFKSHDHRR
jgi:hypothetical protein